MRSFTDYIKQEMELEMPKGNVPGDWFFENHIPMVVRCCCCEMSMASPSAWIDDDGYTYCADCADVVEG